MAAFSNGTEFEIWYAANCFTCEAEQDFINDRDDAGCPLLADAMFGGDKAEGIIPPQWKEIGLGNYECSDFREVSDD